MGVECGRVAPPAWGPRRTEPVDQADVLASGAHELDEHHVLVGAVRIARTLLGRVVVVRRRRAVDVGVQQLTNVAVRERRSARTGGIGQGQGRGRVWKGGAGKRQGQGRGRGREEAERAGSVLAPVRVFADGWRSYWMLLWASTIEATTPSTMAQKLSSTNPNDVIWMRV